jgi:hypothetical protein
MRTPTTSQPRYAAAVFGLALLYACSGSRPSDNQQGQVEMEVSALSSADATTVIVTITGSGIPSPIVTSLTRTNDKWGGLISGIPAGPGRIFAVDVRNGTGEVIYHGQAEADVIANKTVLVTLYAQQSSPTPTNANAAPVIASIVASSTSVAPGDVVTIYVVAHDPDTEDTLSYLWTAAAGVFSAATSPSTNWSAPAAGAGDYAIRIEVQDQKGARAAVSITINVAPGAGSGTTHLSVALNTTPVLSAVKAEPARIDIGDTVDLTSLASDPDGDFLAFLWTVDPGCDGTFVGAGSSNATFTLYQANSASCLFRIQANDQKGGVADGSIAISIGTPISVVTPPQIVAYQSGDTAGAGESVTMRVEAMTANGGVTFAWTSPLGTLGAPASTAGTSEVQWTAPASFTTSAEIRVTITDALTGQSSLQTFVVQPKVTATAIARWHLDEGSGNIAYDSVGNSNGTITNPNWTSGHYNGALESTSKGVTYASVPSNSTLEIPGNQVSLEAWIYLFGNSYLNGQGHAGAIAVKDSYDTGRPSYGLEIGLNWSDNLAFRLSTTENDTVELHSGEACPINQWIHVAGVYDGSEMRLYANGVLKNSIPQHGSISNGSLPFWMGKHAGSNGYDFAYYGKIDEVAVYSTALSSADVLSHFQSVCPVGQSLCGGAAGTGSSCTDMQADRNNCGTCGQLCTDPLGGMASCAAGQCAGTCPSGTQLYGGTPTSGGGGCATGGPTWQWVSGPQLPANAVVSQVWAAPDGEVYVSASRNWSAGQVPESWLYHRKSGVWSTSLHLTDSGLSNATIFGTSGTDVFASVYKCPNGNGSCGAGEGPAMWHFDGAAWSQMTIPNIGLNYFQSIRGGVKDVYASYGAGILRYDGTSWSVSSSEGGNVGFGPLAYIGPNEIYTLGCWGYQAWNGSTWTAHPGFDFCDIGGISGVRTDDGTLQLWAEGSNNFGNGIRAWQFVESPKGSMTGSFGSKYGTYINDVNGHGSGAWSGIWASGKDDFWVVGDYSNNTEGRIWHWDGATWTRQLTTTTITSQAVSIWGTSPADIWVTLSDGRLLHYAD